MLQKYLRPVSLQNRNLKSYHFFINNIIFYIIVSQAIQIVLAKKSYRVDHRISILNDAQWETVPITLKGKSKFDTIYSNVKSIYKKSIINPFNKYITHQVYESESKIVENTENENNNNEEYQPRLKGEEAFQIDFSCNFSTDAKTCRKAENTIKKATDVLSKVLYIYSGPILINATFSSFCELTHPDGSACNADDPSRRKLGQAYPYSSYPAKAVDPVDGDTDTYLYPQALLRQLNIVSDDKPDFQNYDITAEFNSDVNWYFEENEDDRIDDDQHDFLYVAVHELIHGLGFISSWKTPLSMDFHYLTPRAKMGVARNEDVILGWYQMQIFDKYIQFNKSGLYLKDMGKKIMQYENSGEMIRQDAWLEGFHKSEAGQVAQEVYDLATAGKNVFSITSEENNLVTFLQTFENKFLVGTCMGHLDNDEYTNKPDFLLRSYVPKGEDIDDLIQKGSYSYLSKEEKSRKDQWQKTAFGPHLISVMETIGWPTKYHPERRKVEIVNGSLSRYVRNPWNLLIIFFATICVILF
ncbi:hypothetical protein PIROE2DRAFT_12223 [Piromyces sp. E2]|nr:hypothetical protein PIROE2DRAFT_12223 [Piromyces sp. E2]|eukprot:OUM61723.1 hypothetical protein PIROE2DRAFT_12223 [Piromyces sp. E2]